MDARAAQTSAADADGEVVWSWHPDAGVKLAEGIPQATVAKEPGRRGEHEVTVKTIAQGRPDVFGEPVVTTLVCFLFRTRGCGCIGHPAFPAPSDFSGRTDHASLGRFAPRGCGGASDECERVVTHSVVITREGGW